GGKVMDAASLRRADEVDEHVMVARTAIVIERDPIEHLDDRSDLDVQSRFLADLADDRGLERFAQLDGAAWQTPCALERLVRAPYQEHAIAVDDHCANADDRAFRVGPHAFGETPITFTITRFLR